MCDICVYMYVVSVCVCVCVQDLCDSKLCEKLVYHIDLEKTNEEGTHHDDSPMRVNHEWQR